MVRKQIYVTPEQDRLLALRAGQLGVTQSEVIRRALENVADTFTVEARKEVLREVAGIWRDRKDLPDFAKLRREGDERIDG